MNIDDILDIKKGLSMLKEKERKVIYLYFFDGLNEKGIAKRLFISQQRVNFLKKRALSKMKKYLS